MPERAMPIGAEPRPDGTHFRVWAPKRKSVEVVTVTSDQPLWEQKVSRGLELKSTGDGYFSGVVAEMKAGSRYAFALDGEGMFPDPASRFQPFGPHGASEVVDTGAFRSSGNRTAWGGCKLKGQIIYELHVGTFSPEGTYRGVISKLPHLKDVGITVIELMPLADFPGKFGWGYDGVNLFAPSRLYGTPNDLHALIEAAHDIGLGVILDVVYNHLGPSGNYLGQFSDDYLTEHHKTDWGAAINYDAENSKAVREYFVQNAAYWIREFHFDGLRLDATQSIFDDSKTHVLREISEAVREAAEGRDVFIVAENEEQDATLLSDHGMDGVWNDDFHHSAIVSAIGNRQAYYSDFLGAPQEFISAIRHGYLFQGQQYRWQRKRRGRSCLGVSPERFVTYLENHDQVANSAWGERLATQSSPARLRALTALTLLAPGTPMLFQGQEWGSSRPFLFFADHEPDLAKLVRVGRREFMEQFPGIKQPHVGEQLADPSSLQTFLSCKLDWGEVRQECHERWLKLHRDLLRLRREDPAFRIQEYGKVDGAVLSSHAFVLRYFLSDKQDRLVLCNLGPDQFLYHAPEPLLAPPECMKWRLHWSSEEPQYGGSGMSHPDTETECNWFLKADSVAVLVPEKAERGVYGRRLWMVSPEMNENDEAARKELESERSDEH